MKVKLYDSKYRDVFSVLIEDYFKETLKDDYVGDNNKAHRFIDNCIDNKHYIYLLMDKHRVVGFVIAYVFDMYGFSKNYLIIDHMYIKPTFRKTKGIMLLYLMCGHIMKELNIEAIGTTYVDSSNKNNNNKVGGKVIAEVTKISMDCVDKRYDKYLERI